MRNRDAYLDDDDMVPDGGSVRVPMLLTDSRRFAFDAENHRPHYGRPTGAVHNARIVRTAARDAYLRRLTDAWRTMGRDANPPQFTCPECRGTGRDPDDDSPDGRCDECGGTGYIEPPLNSARKEAHETFPLRRSPDTSLRVDARANDVRRTAYAEYVKRIQDAWRQPVDAGGEPDASTQLLRGAPDPGDPSAMMRRHLRTESDDENQRRRDAAWAAYRDRLGSAWQQGRTDPNRATEIERQRQRWTAERP
jgi:hypothetical protein